MQRTILLLLLSVYLLPSGVSHAQVVALTEPNSRTLRTYNHSDADSLTVTSIRGESIELLRSRYSRSAVLIFILHDCPVCNAYAPELNRLATYCEVHGLSLSIVYADDDLSSEEAKEHYSSSGFWGNALLDTAQLISRYYLVSVAPEAVLLDRAGDVIYRGPINNANPYLGMRIPKPTTSDLRDAIQAYIEDKPIPPPRSKLVGCSLANKSEE